MFESMICIIKIGLHRVYLEEFSECYSTVNVRTLIRMWFVQAAVLYIIGTGAWDENSSLFFNNTHFEMTIILCEICLQQFVEITEMGELISDEVKT